LLVDAVVCTKNRPEHLEHALKAIKSHIPYNRIIVVDSSRVPYKTADEGITVYHRSDLNLGEARNFALAKTETEFMFSIDDDINITPETFGALYKKISESPQNVIVTPIASFGDNETRKLIYACHKIACGTAVFLARTELLRSIGGFPPIKFCEDMACRYNVKNAGLHWVTADTECFHPAVLLDNLHKSWRNGYHIIDIYRATPNAGNLFSIVFRAGARIFNSVYFGFRTWSLKCFKWALLPCCCFILAWFHRMVDDFVG